MIEHTPLGAVLKEATSQLAPDDEQYGDAHAILSEAMSKPFEQIGELLNPIDPYPAWGTLFDVYACPGWALPWLAQLVGAVLFPGMTEEQMRYAIDSVMGFKVGTPAAIKAAVQQYLTDTQTVYFRERDASAADPPYSFDVVTLDEETPMSDRTITNLVAQPSSETATSFGANSASTTTPVNAVTNPSGETGTAGWSPRGQNNDMLTNLIANPSGEAGTPTFTSYTLSTSGYPVASVVDSTIWAKFGTHCTLYSVTRDDGAQIVLRTAIQTAGIPVTPGHYYAMRLSFKVVDLQGAALLDALNGRIYWYKADGTAASVVVSTGPGPGGGGVGIGSAGDLIVVGLAPPDAAFAAVSFLINMPAGVVTLKFAGDAALLVDLGTVYAGGIDAATTEQYVPAYFDGTMVGCAWTGSAHSSTSTRNDFSTTDEVLAKYGTRSFRIMRDIDGAGAATCYISSATASRPVAVPGDYVAVRCSMRSRSVSRNFQILVNWFDAGGVSIGSTLSSPVTPTAIGEWTDAVFIVGPAPANTASVQVRFDFASVAEGEVHYLDGIACYVTATVPSTVPAYVDGDMLGFAWTGTAHASTSSPRAALRTRHQDWAAVGTWSVRYTCTRDDGAQVTLRSDNSVQASGANGRFPIDTTHYYAFRMTVRMRNTCGPLNNLHLSVTWYASDNTTVVGISSHGPYVYNPTPGVYDIYLIAKPNDGSAYASIRAWFDLSPGVVVLDADCDAMAMYDLGARWESPTNENTEAADVPPYIDGSMPGCSWSGTAHGSTSTRPPTTSLVYDTIKRWKPAGLIFTYRSVPGYDWQQVPIDHATWSVVVTTYDNWRKLVYNDRS